MAVQFIFGRAGAGKTHWCLDAIAGELSSSADGSALVLLVPEQASFQMERALALRAPGAGFIRARVLSFSRLAQQVLEDGPQSLPLLSRAARILALRAVVAPLSSELKALGAAAKTPGFFRGLDRLIETLLTERVSPTTLDEAGAALAEAPGRTKLRELARAYAAYRTWLAGHAVDPAQRLELLCAQVGNTPWLRDAAIWVDGFAGFTGQELATLVELGRTAREMRITLLTSPGGSEARGIADSGAEATEFDLFRKTRRTLATLSARFVEAGVTIEPPIHLRPAVLPRFRGMADLQRLEAMFCAVDRGDRATSPAIADQPAVPELAPSAVRLLQCQTHREELEQAVRFIRERMAIGGGALRFRDFAVIARDLGEFAPLVADVFEEFDLPYFLDLRRPLASHPLSRFLQAAVAAACDDCSLDAMRGLLRSELAPLDRWHAAELDRRAVGQMLRGRAAWLRERWDFSADRPALALTDSVARRDVGSEPADVELDAARLRLMEWLRPLLDLADLGAAEGSGPSPSGAEWAAALHAFLRDAAVPRRVEAWVAEARAKKRWETAQAHTQAWAAVCEILDDLHALLARMPVSGAEILAIVQAALAECSLGLAPPAVDQVLISAIERSRHPDIKFAWVFAFNEGLFPRPPADDPLLARDEREALVRAGVGGLDTPLDEALAERLLAYIAITRPSHGLTISYARTGEDGEERLPSSLLTLVQRALPGARIEHPCDDAPPVTLAELAWRALKSANQGTADTRSNCIKTLIDEFGRDRGIAPTLEYYTRGLEAASKLRSATTVGSYRLPRGAARGVVWHGSISEIETHLQCSWKHFARHGMRLLDPPGSGRAEREIGDVFHALLADVVTKARAAANPPERCIDFDDDRWRGFVAAALSEFRTRQAPDLASRRPELAFVVARGIGERLEEIVLAHAARWRRGRFAPVAVEQRFGDNRDGAWRGAELKLVADQKALLRGILDRLDSAPTETGEFALLYDYKSGARFDRKHAFLIGYPLQAFAYLWAVAQIRAEMQPAGVLIAPYRPNSSCLTNDYFVQSPASEQTMFLYQPRGLIRDDAVDLLDAKLSSGRSPVAALRRTRDGDLYAKCDAVSAAELDQRIAQAAATIRQGATAIALGVVEAAPLRVEKTLACHHCDYIRVCRYDRRLNHPRRAEEVLPPREVAPERPSGGAG